MSAINNSNISKRAGSSSKKRKPLGVRIAQWCAIILTGFIIIIIASVAAVTCWLTPSRLSSIINDQASKHLKADFHVENARFTFWSSFPHLTLEFDSIRIVSRALDSLPDSIAASLPGNYRYLASTSKAKASINVMALVKGEIAIKEITVTDADINLVAATESLANYNILPTKGSLDEIPAFTAEKIELLSPRNLKFYSRPSTSDIDVDLQQMKFIHIPHELNRYTLTLGGDICAATADIELLDQFPFRLEGNVGFKFHPFNVKVSNYNIALGNTHGKLNLDFIGGDEMKLNDFSYSLSSFHLAQFLNYLPKSLIQIPDALKGDLSLNLSARLTSPYKFSDNALPSLDIFFDVENGSIIYSTGNGRQYGLQNVSAEGKLFFDGKNRSSSYFELQNLNLAGEGMKLNLSAHAGDIFNAPQVAFNMHAAADTRAVGKKIAVLQPYGLSGNMSTAMKGEFTVYGLKNINIKNIRLDGNATIKDFAFRYPAAFMDVTGKSLDIALGGTGSALNFNIPLNVDLGPTDIHIINPKDSTDIRFNGLELHGSAKMCPETRNLASAAAKISGKEITGEFRGATVNINGLDLFASAKKIGKPVKIADFNMPDAWMKDKFTQGFAPHTPVFLSANLSQSLRNTLANWNANMDIRINRGELITPVYPVKNIFSGLHACASLDSIVLHRLFFKTQSSAMTLAAKTTNLRQFLCSKSVAPLYLDIDARLDTIQINQIAGAYEYGQLVLGQPSAADGNADEPANSPSDTTAFLIPRNLIANINASAKMTHYTNLKLYDLNAGINIENGNASADKISISSDFGRLKLGFNMATEDMQRFGIKLNGDVEDVNLVNFFRNFHTLLLMMPQMKNLDGVLSADFNLSAGYFPNMYIDIPSLNADIGFKGQGLTLHQDPFIRKITRMLLIHNSGDIHIKDLDVSAKIFNNLVELYPFDVVFENYSLRMQGINNFSGDMYYHIGVNHSPIPFPFGVNIQGNFSDPQVRFGGASYKVNRGAQISRSIMEVHRINMVRLARKYLKEFLRKAAESDTTPESEYLFTPAEGKHPAK